MLEDYGSGDKMGKGKYLEARVKRLLAEDIKYQRSDLALFSRIWFEDLKEPDRFDFGIVFDFTSSGIFSEGIAAFKDRFSVKIFKKYSQ